ncbi:MAG: hypothetical protein J6T40_07490 [Clostridiales bacterium]|nr:hypothetical protein [Clostridiales bacterium]
MNMKVKKLACVTLSFAMIISAAACGKKSSKKEASPAGEAAETILEAVTSLSVKKLKKINGMEDTIETFEEIASCDAIKAVMDKASFEINEDEIKEKKKKTTVPVTVTMPDYEAAAEEADGDEDDFIEAIEAQKEKKYVSVDVDLEFEVEDDEYTLTNGPEFCQELLMPVIEACEDFLSITSPTTEISVETDDTDPTTAAPTDDTTATTAPTDETKDTTPAPTDDTSATTTSSGPAAKLEKVTPKKIKIDKDVFEKILKEVDPDSAKSIISTGAGSVGSTATTETVVAYDADFELMYQYYEFADVATAKGYYDSMTGSLKSICTNYEVSDDWGFVSYQYSDYTCVYYFSDNGMIVALSMSSAAEKVEKINEFAKALCK